MLAHEPRLFFRSEQADVSGKFIKRFRRSVPRRRGNRIHQKDAVELARFAAVGQFYDFGAATAQTLTRRLPQRRARTSAETVLYSDVLAVKIGPGKVGLFK